MRRRHTIIALAVAVVLLAGCKTKERIVTIETVRTDTTYITRHERDSIHEHDSIRVSEKQRGDTIFVEVERVRRIYIDKTKHDTIREATHDTIPKPYPMEVMVEKPLTRWQRLRLRIADMLLCAMAVGAVISIIRIKKKFLP